jgi:hypothetical protein
MKIGDSALPDVPCKERNRNVRKNFLKQYLKFKLNIIALKIQLF